jgi:hypothetical protein
VVWNTVRASPLAINNSLGEIGEGQLKRYRDIYNSGKLGRKNLVHLMHHKLALPSSGLTWGKRIESGCSYFKWPFVWFSRHVQMAGMVLTNAGEVVTELKNNNCHSVVLHGHHHSRFSGALQVNSKSVATVVSACSSTLGAESWAPYNKLRDKIDESERSFEVLSLRAGVTGMTLVSQKVIRLQHS